MEPDVAARVSLGAGTGPAARLAAAGLAAAALAAATGPLTRLPRGQCPYPDSETRQSCGREFGTPIARQRDGYVFPELPKLLWHRSTTEALVQCSPQVSPSTPMAIAFQSVLTAPGALVRGHGRILSLSCAGFEG